MISLKAILPDESELEELEESDIESSSSSLSSFCDSRCGDDSF